jgi:anti-sigma regulatory factor (Ser/Thr protein kinase)
MTEGGAALATATGRYRHEAFLYSGTAEFGAVALSFLSRAVQDRAPALVVVSRPKIELLRRELGPRASRVSFTDMADIGRNPARIIAAWSAFVRAHDGAPQLYGIGEPVHPGRSPAELAECQLHEALLNVAFSSATPLWLLCPYDLETLAAEVIDEAGRTHPFIARGEGRAASGTFQPIDRASPLRRPLPGRPAGTEPVAFSRGALGQVRAYVAAQAARAGLTGKAASDLVLAVNEIATNSLQHGGGRGELRAWTEGQSLVCEVTDRGHITAPLAGRLPPALDGRDGGGLWLVNQLCDLVQISSAPAGTTVRLHQSSAR